MVCTAVLVVVLKVAMITEKQKEMLSGGVVVVRRRH